MEQPWLTVQSLSKKVGPRSILTDITFTVQAGESVALLGPNGAGKSSLLHVLATLSRPTAGSILWHGKPLAKVAHAYRARLGFLGHEVFLYSHLTAAENLLFFSRMFPPARPSGPQGMYASNAENEDCIVKALRWAGLQWFAYERTANFSRGMKQRLALARLWLQSPTLLLLDEPFTGLDQQGKSWLETTLMQWREEGRSILFSSHDSEQALRLSDRYFVLKNGKIVQSGNSSETDPRDLDETLSTGN